MRRMSLGGLLALVVMSLLLAGSMSAAPATPVDQVLADWRLACSPVLEQINSINGKTKAFNAKAETSITPAESDAAREEYNADMLSLVRTYKMDAPTYKRAECQVLAAMLRHVREELRGKTQKEIGDFWFNKLRRSALTLRPNGLPDPPKEVQVSSSLTADASWTGRAFLLRAPRFQPFVDVYDQDEKRYGALKVLAVYRKAKRGERDKYPLILHHEELRVTRTELIDVTGKILHGLSQRRVHTQSHHERSGIVFVGAVAQMQFVTHSHTVAWRWDERDAALVSWSKQVGDRKIDANGITLISSNPDESLDCLRHPFFQDGVYRVWPSY